MIRAGVESDLPEIVRMCGDFWLETVYSKEYQIEHDPETTRAFADLCMAHGLMAVLEVDGKVCGFACGLKSFLLGNAGVCTGSEVAWWVDPEHRQGKNGVSLLVKLEDMAKSEGVIFWSMMFMRSSMPEAIEGIYKKMGYFENEIAYTKRIL